MVELFVGLVVGLLVGLVAGYASAKSEYAEAKSSHSDYVMGCLKSAIGNLDSGQFYTFSATVGLHDEGDDDDGSDDAAPIVPQVEQNWRGQ